MTLQPRRQVARARPRMLGPILGAVACLSCRSDEDDEPSPDEFIIETDEESDSPPGVDPPEALSCSREEGKVRLTWKNPQRYAAILVLADHGFLDELPGDAEEYQAPRTRTPASYQLAGHNGTTQSDYAECSPPNLSDPEPPASPDIATKTGSPGKPRVDPLEARYGVEESSPLHDAFLFVDGEYIEPPHVVRRKGLSVLVNDVRIVSAPYHCGPLLEPTGPPEPPEELVSRTLWDPEIEEYMDGYLFWICRSLRKGRQEGIGSSMKRFIEDMPCVLSVDDSALGSLVVRGRDGSRRVFRLWTPCSYFHEPAEEEVLLAADRAAREMMEHLISALSRSQGSLFFFRPAVRIEGIDVAQAIRLLRMERMNRAFSPELDRLLGPEAARVFRDRFRETESLMRRLPGL
jgi:hypothetical protein